MFDNILFIRLLHEQFGSASSLGLQEFLCTGGSMAEQPHIGSPILRSMLNSHHARLLILCSISCKYSACGKGALYPLIHWDYTDCPSHKTACER